MNRCYSEALVMPSNYAGIDRNEMMDVEGGKLSYAECTLNFAPAYLTKAGALAAAEGFAGKVLWDDKVYTKERLAAEIFTHALAYAVCYGPANVQLPFNIGNIISLASYVIADHANPINLGGDNFVEESCFYACWVYAK